MTIQKETANQREMREIIQNLAEITPDYESNLQSDIRLAELVDRAKKAVINQKLTRKDKIAVSQALSVEAKKIKTDAWRSEMQAKILPVMAEKPGLSFNELGAELINRGIMPMKGGKWYWRQLKSIIDPGRS